MVDFTPWLRELSQALERSEIAIYPVPQIMLGSTDAPPDAPGVPASAGTVMMSDATLNQFADMTGGRAGVDRDIAAAITQATMDARTSYRIGYYAPEESADGKFHKLRIACTRNGVRIQAKTGYYAWPQAPDAEALQAIRAAITQPVDAAEIGLRATLVQDPGSAATRHLRFGSTQTISLCCEGDRYSGHLSLLVSGYDASGAAHPSQVRESKLSYTAQERDRALAEGLSYTLDAPAGKDVNLIRFIALDDVSGSTGTITIGIQSAGTPGN